VQAMRRVRRLLAVRTRSWEVSWGRSEEERGGDEPADHDNARDHRCDAWSRQGFTFADRGVHRPPSAPCQGSGHDTRHDQQDPNRLPRPMERLPRKEPCGCDAGSDECERSPKPRKIRPFIRELELRFRTPFAHVPHPRSFEMPRA
jgi:hypothetical protein